jgi:hypothetical protein
LLPPPYSHVTTLTLLAQVEKNDYKHCGTLTRLSSYSGLFAIWTKLYVDNNLGRPSTAHLSTLYGAFGSPLFFFFLQTFSTTPLCMVNVRCLLSLCYPSPSFVFLSVSIPSPTKTKHFPPYLSHHLPWHRIFLFFILLCIVSPSIIAFFHFTHFYPPSMYTSDLYLQIRQSSLFFFLPLPKRPITRVHQSLGSSFKFIEARRHSTPLGFWGLFWCCLGLQRTDYVA